ncbi:unnamed protein product [Alopecurus aequalis]
MARQVGNSVGRPKPDVVGIAFAHKYYSILNESPESAHKFYHDESIIGRPDCDGTMRSITTTREIKKYYLSTDLKGCPTQIDHVDTQTSHEGGLTVLVAGSLIMPDTVKYRFIQSFFLAPQGIDGYFVLNDALRYVTPEPETLPVKESTKPVKEGPVKESTDPVKENMDAERPFSDYIFLLCYKLPHLDRS